MLMYLIKETARHNGRIGILREMAGGAPGRGTGRTVRTWESACRPGAGSCFAGADAKAVMTG